jgi:hypothetical protein
LRKISLTVFIKMHSFTLLKNRNQPLSLNIQSIILNFLIILNEIEPMKKYKNSFIISSSKEFNKIYHCSFQFKRISDEKRRRTFNKEFILFWLFVSILIFRINKNSWRTIIDLSRFHPHEQLFQRYFKNIKII